MNDWIPASAQRPADGQVCYIRVKGGIWGDYEIHGEHFLHDDGHWYRIDPPTRITPEVTAWRPA